MLLHGVATEVVPLIIFFPTSAALSCNILLQSPATYLPSINSSFLKTISGTSEDRLRGFLNRERFQNLRSRVGMKRSFRGDFISEKRAAPSWLLSCSFFCSFLSSGESPFSDSPFDLGRGPPLGGGAAGGLLSAFIKATSITLEPSEGGGCREGETQEELTTSGSSRDQRSDVPDWPSVGSALCCRRNIYQASVWPSPFILLTAVEKGIRGGGELQ